MTDRNLLGIIYTNIHDDGLGVLIAKRTVASIPFGGRYRLVDFVLSNMVNSGVGDVGLITRSNYHSLLDHVGSGADWDLARKRGGLSIFPPYSRAGNGIYRGSLEALGGIIGYIRDNPASYVVISDCDVIASIDLQEMLKFHKEHGGGMTLAYGHLAADIGDSGSTVIKVGANCELLDATIEKGQSAEKDRALNLSIFDKDVLLRVLSDALTHNRFSFLSDVLQNDIWRKICRCWRFDGFAYHITGLESYFLANMELLKKDVRDELFSEERPVYTKVRDQVPAKYGLRSGVSNSLIADGCVIDGTVENSVIFRGVRIARGAVIRNSVIMQGSVIGEGADLNYCIADKDVLIHDGRRLSGYVTFPLFIPKKSSI